MINRDVFATDPALYQLANQGVAKLSFPPIDEDYRILEAELRSFVCNGAYADGLVRIIEGFNRAAANQSDIPGVWVSGFFGSGKSHLASMLGALWTNIAFADGSTAEGLISNLPTEVKAALRELRASAKRAGGSLTVGGTMGRGASDPAAAIAGFVFRGVGLPDDPRASTVALWLAREGVLDAVRAELGHEFEAELRTFVLSEKLQTAILRARPSLAENVDVLSDRLATTFPDRAGEPMSVDEMERLIGEALRLGRKEIPLTLVILDELQQFLGENQELTLRVQTIAERMSQRFGGRLLLVATGQQALTQVPYLQRILDRFNLQVQLRETDIDSVIRQTVLAKKAEQRPALEAMLTGASGELHRQLQGSKLKHAAHDDMDAPLDWPLLPARRRLWETILRELDSTRMRSSLRGQLRTTLDAAQEYAGKPLGHAVPLDFLYRSMAPDALNAGELPRDTWELIERLRSGDATSKLKSRVLMVVFLLARISKTVEVHGVVARADIIADLLIEDLGGDHQLRGQVPDTLKLLASEGAVIEIGGAYRLQTKESAEWDSAFKSEMRARDTDPSAMVRLRRELVAAQLDKSLADAATVTQGATRESRHVRRIGPNDKAPENAIVVRQHIGYDTSMTGVLKEIAAAAPSDPTIHLIVEAADAEPLSALLTTRIAAETVLAQRGPAATDDGREARSAMMARRAAAERDANEIIARAVAKARILLAGGAEEEAATPAVALKAAAQRAMQRMYDRFDAGDHAGWGSAYTKAKAGAPDALKVVDHSGGPETHPVAQAILSALGSGKRGVDIRAELSAPPYGWNDDAIDTMLLMLSRDHLLVTAADGQSVSDPATLARATFRGCTFKRNTRPITTPERLRVRKLLTDLHVPFQNGQEGDAVADLIAALDRLADSAGGEAPAPAAPVFTGLAEARAQGGAARLGAVADQAEAWRELLPAYREAAARIGARRSAFALLRRLVDHGADGQAGGMAAIVAQRSLITDPDPVPPLLTAAADSLRTKANADHAAWQTAWTAAEAALHADPNWTRLTPEQRHDIRTRNRLLQLDPPKVGTPEEIATSLDACSIAQRRAETSAIKGRVEDALMEAAQVFAPKVRSVALQRTTIEDAAGVDAWLATAREALLAGLADGPVRPGF